MSSYSGIVAKNMKLPEEQVQLIINAAPMHDVGKIGIPDQILSKPEKLNPEEWTIIKNHTLMGGRILENADDDLIKAGQIIVLSHHEKWDGSGYPKTLKGEDIPLMGRITAIADVFDALTSKRPYKSLMSNEKAFGIIEDTNSIHFDPEVGKAFFDGIDEILFAQKQCRDTGIQAIQFVKGYAKKNEKEENIRDSLNSFFMKCKTGHHSASSSCYITIISAESFLNSLSV